jgi:hypothetical protein
MTEYTTPPSLQPDYVVSVTDCKTGRQFHRAVRVSMTGASAAVNAKGRREQQERLVQMAAKELYRDSLHAKGEL